jgi:hypothetical protein
LQQVGVIHLYAAIIRPNDYILIPYLHAGQSSALKLRTLIIPEEALQIIRRNGSKLASRSKALIDINELHFFLTRDEDYITSMLTLSSVIMLHIDDPTRQVAGDFDRLIAA